MAAKSQLHSKNKLNRNWFSPVGLALLAIFLGSLLIYKLGSLVSGFSLAETKTVAQIVGWHGMYANPQFLPLKFVRSIIFYFFSNHADSVYLTRLPNVIFGALTVLSFSALVYFWHGRRTAILATLMFGCSAWTLHASRLASSDVMYLWAITTVLLGYVCLSEFPGNLLIWYGNLIMLGLSLTIPGLIWLVILMLYFEIRVIKRERQDSLRLVHLILGIIPLLIWLPFIIHRLTNWANLWRWLGVPVHWPGVWSVIRNILAVPFHLVYKGPLLPQLWLIRSPAFDAFTLVMLLLGLYFYFRHWQSSRSQLLAGLLILSIILIGLNAGVSFALVIPLAYVLVAMGIAYIIHVWRRIFPRNPLAKWFSLGLIIIAVCLSCVYNVRSYFVAWPNNPTTYRTFDRYPNRPYNNRNI